MAKQLVEFTKLDTKKILINPNLIETVEATPDTVIILNTGRKLLVKESISEILDKISD
ncbi:flagellar FlbD family protein [Butyrivibrio proteoclasticus]|uniref:flagellar FlbD family protein n=1 Tax=Butyrivibrio proteoclasticus TaxID=43305 RepID=UPI0009DDBEC7|nr:flagellar FlbD family protein [Butyrivibrio proteoclasticus]